MRKKLVVFTGAGVSAESGIKTFRDSGGLWEEYKITEVATPEAWKKNMPLVLDFYNKRRKQMMESKPNDAHTSIARLEKHYEVTVITQNIDNLHEKAGSTNVVHLHGEIMKARSTFDPRLIYDLKSWEIKLGDKCEKGSQLRPHIVWFGEPVPMMERAAEIASQADIFLIIGTSLQVYPAAGLINFAPPEIPKYYIDPSAENAESFRNLMVIKSTATFGMKQLEKELTKFITEHQ